MCIRDRSHSFLGTHALSRVAHESRSIHPSTSHPRISFTILIVLFFAQRNSRAHSSFASIAPSTHTRARPSVRLPEPRHRASFVSPIRPSALESFGDAASASSSSSSSIVDVIVAAVRWDARCGAVGERAVANARPTESGCPCPRSMSSSSSSNRGVGARGAWRARSRGTSSSSARAGERAL